MKAFRVRLGTALIGDRWHILFDQGNGVEVSEREFDTEEEADAFRQELAATIKAEVARRGGQLVDLNPN